MPRPASGSSVAPAERRGDGERAREDLTPRGGEEDAHGAGLAVDQRRGARDALARRALNVVVVVLMACVIVAAKPLSSDRGSISLSNLRVLGHEIAVGHAHFLLDTPAREGANVLPSASAGAV